MSEVPLYLVEVDARAPHPKDPTVGLRLGPYGGPRGGLFLMSEVPLYLVEADARGPDRHPWNRLSIS